MSFKAFRKVSTTDRVLSLIQDAIDSCLRPIVGNPALDSVTVKDVLLKAGQVNPVSHMLGRKLERWSVVRIWTNAVVWEETAKPPSETLVYLHVSADAVVDLLVS